MTVAQVSATFFRTLGVRPALGRDFAAADEVNGGASVAILSDALWKALGAKTDFRYVEGRGHFDLYTVGDDRSGLYKAIAREMYALARPGSKPRIDQ